MRTKPRLLIVGAFPPDGSEIIGGIVTSCRSLMRSRFADRFDIITVDSTQISNPPPGLMRRMVGAFFRGQNFFDQLRRHKPEAVLLFTSGGASLIEKGTMAWICRCFGVPAVLFPRSGGIMISYDASFIWRRLIRFCFAGAALILCQGGRWQDFVVRKLGYPVAQAPVLTNWTASEELLAIGRARKVSDGQMSTRLIFVGWLEQSKGVFELIDALSPLAERMNFTLSIVGDGHARKAVEAQVATGPIAALTTFRGWMPPDAIPEILAQHDILVLPSWAEGLPNAMIEAMAAGLSVIVTSVGNVPDFVRDDENGLVIPPRDVPALRGALARLIPDAALQSRLGRAGHQIAAERFSVDRAAEDLTHTFDALIAHRSGVRCAD